MWIKTQNGRQIINSDQVINIFTARTSPTILCNTTDDADYVTLGEYNSQEDCKIVLDKLFGNLVNRKYTFAIMPKRDAVQRRDEYGESNTVSE